MVKDYPEFDKSLLDKTTLEKPIEPKTIKVEGPAEDVFKEAVHKETQFNAAKPDYMSEAKTRKIYIDLYLREAGWEVCEEKDVCVPGKAGIEIRVEGMPNNTNEGFCDYVLYGRNGLPLAVVEAKKTSVSPEKGRHQVCLYGECLKRNMDMRRFYITPTAILSKLLTVFILIEN